jgi:hypothetical protein
VVPAAGGVGGEEDVLVRPAHAVDAAEDRDRGGGVAVADVVLAAVGSEAACTVRGEDHVGGVDVRAVLLLRQPERAHPAGVQRRRGPRPGSVVVALPHRAETKDGDLPRVPVLQAVEAEDLRHRGIPAGVPPLVRVASGVPAWSEEGGEHVLFRHELQEVGVVHLGVVIADQFALAAPFEPVNGRAQQPPGLGIEMLRIVAVRV